MKQAHIREASGHFGELTAQDTHGFLYIYYDRKTGQHFFMGFTFLPFLFFFFFCFKNAAFVPRF